MTRLVAKLAALTLVAGASVIAGPTAAEGHGSSHKDQSSLVRVDGFGNHVELSRSEIPEGRTTFTVAASTAHGSQVTLFRLARHATLADFKADLVNAFTPKPAISAKGTRGLKGHARFFGLADVVKGTPAKVTVQLSAGTYYLMDLAIAPGKNGPKFTTLKVWESHHGNHRDASESGGDSGHVPTIKMRGHSFDSPRVLPANGTVRVKNTADTIHFMAMEPVRKGTTDAQIQSFFDHPTGPPPFALSTPGVGLDVLSPGKRAELTYKVGKGTYVLLCFMTDEKTGMPHAFMGMHKVVTLQ